VLPVLALFSTFARERQRRIDNALELSSAYRGTAMLLGDVIEADDEYTGTHSRDVVDLVVAVADELGLASRDRRRAEFAALLHDIGKVKIPAEIIHKPGPLDDDEWELMKTHTLIGSARSARSCARATSAGTAPAIPTAWRAGRSRSKLESSARATRGAR
jgi:HD-GYP domain-containing protein (c-di-GMP phosphodiesterase class II)